ncbi:transcriptional coactivator p15/PC4 family protein [Rhizobium sp. LjRoot30]|uniref:transcriptional coactivator p15/PC4 family protein n=1 Tax=Rhizobium sp. LjRoot30 TaxID=3342320 RepID=UPI003ECFA9DC
MTEDTIIATVKKNSRENLRVSLGKFVGHNLLNLRLWFTADVDGMERPSKSGFSLRITLIPELIAALQQAEAEARRRGLIRKENDHAA